MIVVIPANSPRTLSCDSFCIRIQKDIVFVEEKPFFRTIRTIHTICVLKFFDVKSINDHGIDITNLVGIRKWNDGKRLFLCAVEQKQFAGGSSAGMDSKIHSVLKRSGSVQIIDTRAHRKSGDFRHWHGFIWMIGYKFLMIRFHFLLHYKSLVRCNLSRI